MGVAKLVFALIGTAHQTAPSGVQLSALLLDIIHCLWVWLDQAFCCLTKRVHLGKGAGKQVSGEIFKTKTQSYIKLNCYVTDLITEGCQVSLKAFMFTLQSLNTGQVMTVIVSVECLVLLLNPLFSFISIPVETQLVQVYRDLLCVTAMLILCAWTHTFLIRGQMPVWFIPVESLHLMGTAQHVAPFFSQLLQWPPAII